MKKPVIISIIIGVILFVGVAYIAINRIAEEKAKEEIARKEKEEQRKKDIEYTQKELIRYKDLLNDVKVKLQLAHDNLNDLRGFQFLRTQDEKDEQLTDQYYKIQELEKLQDSTQSKIEYLQTRIAQLQSNQE